MWAQRLNVADCSTTLTTQISIDVVLAGEDFQRIMSVSLIEGHPPSSFQSDCKEEEVETDHVSSQDEGSITDDSSDEGDLKKLLREVERPIPDGSDIGSCPCYWKTRYHAERPRNDSPRPGGITSRELESS